MIDFEAINLNAAKTHFALANVPMYIARKLREDPAILKIALENSADVLLDEFARRVANEPTNLREQVYPFALAVAAALKQDAFALKQMDALDTGLFGWLPEMIEGLIEQQQSAVTEGKVGERSRDIAYDDRLPVTDASSIAANMSMARLG